MLMTSLHRRSRILHCIRRSLLCITCYARPRTVLCTPECDKSFQYRKNRVQAILGSSKFQRRRRQHSMQGKVEIAGVNTAKLKVLKNEETMELLRRAKAGRPAGPAGADRGKSAAGALGDPAVCRPGRERGRPLSGGLRRASSRPSTISTSTSRCAFPPTACP